MTLINIGTNYGNIIDFKIYKSFEEITGKDVFDIAKEHFKEKTQRIPNIPLRIYGWADITPYQVQETEEIKHLAGLLRYAIDHNRLSGDDDEGVVISDRRDTFENIANDYLNSLK